MKPIPKPLPSNSQETQHVRPFGITELPSDDIGDSRERETEWRLAEGK